MGNCGSSPDVKEAPSAVATVNPPAVAAKYEVPTSDSAAPSAAAAAAPAAAAPAAAAPPVPAPIDPGAVQETLMQVSTLMQKFAEGRSERTTPVQALKQALDLVVADVQGSFACVHSIGDKTDGALLVSLSPAAPDKYLNSYRLISLDEDTLALPILLNSGQTNLSWNTSSENPPPEDWQLLADTAGLKHLSGAPIMVGERCIGMLTIGFDKLEGRQNFGIWPTYMNLVASSLVSMIKDNSIPKYVHMAREIHEAADLDLLMHSVIQQFRIVLGHTNNQHVWYRCALTSFTTLTATIFDDLTQVPASNMQRGGDNAGSLNNSINSSGSYKLLKDVQAAGGIMRSCVNLKSTVMKISIHNRQQVMIPDVQKLINQSGNVSADIFNTRLIKPPTAVLVFPLKVQQHIFGAVFCMSSVQTDFADVAPRVREMCEVLAPHVLLILNGKMKDEYQAMQAASSNPVDSIHMSFSKDMSMGLNSSGIGIGNSDGNFVFAQSRSSTGALVTGLTEKLNQKRIKSSMEFNGNNELLELQINHLLGEGGFAKVFRGLWRGLVVGVKVVCDDGKNEKMVVKNAHEIAILTAISHPNVVQAYTCMTDIMVRDMCTVCMRNATQQVLTSPAYKYLMSMEERPCHIEVIEYCDLGNLSTALKSHVFHQRGDDCKLLDLLANAASRGMPDLFTPESANPGVDPVINMTSLTLTLIEIASAMGELHKMGVVHCDLKPANVLLKSSNNDPRGFTAKVSDFGLSRVEDDDSAASFPFNSCGTAAYVAPEALISNKKVTSSVDVYAFGILMCEMHMAQRPYGNMKQQQLVEEVVMWGIRPKFNGSAPQEYVALSQACWNGLPTSRPTFDEVVATLSMMLESYTPPRASAPSRSNSVRNSVASLPSSPLANGHSDS